MDIPPALGDDLISNAFPLKMRADPGLSEMAERVIPTDSPRSKEELRAEAAIMGVIVVSSLLLNSPLSPE